MATSVSSFPVALLVPPRDVPDVIVLPNVVSVSGTVGVGKTTVLDLLETSDIFSYVAVPHLCIGLALVDLPSPSASSLSSLVAVFTVRCPAVPHRRRAEGRVPRRRAPLALMMYHLPHPAPPSPFHAPPLTPRSFLYTQ